jgi:hypothetical protein
MSNGNFNIPPGDLDIIKAEVKEWLYGRSLSGETAIDEWKTVSFDQYDIHFYDTVGGRLEAVVYPVENGQTITDRWHHLDLSQFGIGSKPEVKLTEKLTDEERVPDLSYVKKGDRVWDSWLRKWLNVDYTTPQGTIVFETNLVSRHDGRQNHGGPPRYYPNKFEVPEEAFTTPLPDLPVDTPVWVNEGGEWLKRHFAEWDDEERDMLVWGGGKTSHTNTSNYAKEAWSIWSLTEPKEETK